MSHLILLGDSIFDNASYVPGEPDVIAQVREILPATWKASLLASDGATTDSVKSQLARMPADATHLVLSVGGNNALMREDVLHKAVRSTGEALNLMARVGREFEAAYRKVVADCIATGLPLSVCTIYNGNFTDPAYQQQVAVALTVFNDAIIRISVESRLTVIELRQVCTRPEDYANQIEPSSTGGAKIAQVIKKAVTGSLAVAHGAHVIGT